MEDNGIARCIADNLPKFKGKNIIQSIRCVIIIVIKIIEIMIDLEKKYNFCVLFAFGIFIFVVICF